MKVAFVMVELNGSGHRAQWEPRHARTTAASRLLSTDAAAAVSDRAFARAAAAEGALLKSQ
jgi:hypothetical protein